MAQPFTISCEMIVIPGGGSMQNKIVMKVNGNTAFEGYEQELSPGIREAISKIAEAHAESITSWSRGLTR